MKLFLRPQGNYSTAFNLNILPLLRRPLSKGAYIPELDGLRFIAILAVVVQHLSERLTRIQSSDLQAQWLDSSLHYAASRGSIGVLLFFAISGFILSMPYWNGKSIQYTTYLKNRLLRIEPPYLIWMSLFALLVWLSGRITDGLGQHWLASIAYVHTLSYGEFSVINPVAWSLEIEIQFYLLAPWIVLFFKKYLPTRFRPSLLSLIIVLYTLLMQVMGWQQGLLKYTLLGQLPYFLVGIWLADLYQQGKLKLPIGKNKLLWVLIGWLVMMYSWSENLGLTLIFLLALSAFFALAFQPSFFQRLLRSPWIAGIGGMCYSIYLIHLAALEGLSNWSKGWLSIHSYGLSMLVHGVLWLVPIFLFSVLAYLLLEKPFMEREWPSQLKNWLQQSRQLMIRTSVTVLIGGTFFWGTQASAQTDTIRWQGKALAPLSILIERAQQNSNALKANDREVEILALERDITKRQWMQHVSVVAGVDAGNGNYVSTNTEAFTAINSSLNRKAVQFAVGVNVQLPLSSFGNRKAEIQKRSLMMEKELLLKAEQGQLIRAEVINRYTRFKESIQLLDLQAGVIEASEIKLTAAEKYFKEAQLSVEDFSQVMEQHFQSKMELERKKSAVENALLLLENIVGTSIYDLL
ncbi:MAG: acyltransferase family protein [Haliscomenobacter sp.]|uniref:acyltransferase family protein n=1 Tax=Haliscomenobacter sp. TaxID=2717303 RepID=UPI0029A1CFF7|nr:acyltransferase family protein [Haliscomenobacter sp.]MDX2068082.1 acyltransferase family protein [Haliscomenobacter sp.]